MFANSIAKILFFVYLTDIQLFINQISGPPDAHFNRTKLHPE